MSEAVIPSTPNWFLNDCIQIGQDGFIVYGTLSVGIAILAPSKTERLFSDLKIIHPAHKARISSVSLCPQWITTRALASGSDDGFVKLWNAETLASKFAHNVHLSNKEVVVGVAFLNSKLIASLGSLGYLTAWNIHSNTVQTNQKILKGYKPICLSVCPHKDNVLAVGTKQGVVIVLSIAGEYNDTLKILFKAPGHDSEITSISWCPTLHCEYFDNMSSYPKLSKKHSESKNKSIQHRINDIKESADEKNKDIDINIKPEYENDESKNLEKSFSPLAGNKTTPEEKSAKLDSVATSTNNKTPDFLEECNALLSLIKSRGKNTKTEPLSSDSDDCSSPNDLNASMLQNPAENTLKESSLSDGEHECLEESLNNSTNGNNLDDSDIFDIYKDHAVEEFGHKKYVREDDAEFLKSIATRPIIKAKKASHKNKTDEKKLINISEIIPEETQNEKEKLVSDSQTKETSRDVEELATALSTVNINKSSIDNTGINAEIDTKSLYLASCCKKGNLCVWRWGGILMMSEEIKSNSKSKFKKKVTHPFGAVLWASPTKIIAAAKDSQVVCCNFTNEMTIIHLHDAHKRGLFSVISNPTESIDKSIVWTVSMDRLLASYSFETKLTTVYSTFGGYVYDVQISPIDSNVFAVGCGDGMIRIWRIVEKDGVIQMPICLRQLWNGINGKILSLAWHPNKENCLAFSTFEGKVGILNASTDGPAQILPFALSLGVFHICWGLPNLLFACGGETLIVYDAKATPITPEKIDVNVFDSQWNVSTMSWTEKYLTVGSSQGGLALLSPSKPFELRAGAYAHRKAITCIAWHPTAITTEDDLSPWADLIAVSAKSTNIVIMKTFELDGKLMLETFRNFTTHEENVTNLCWSPHHNGKLLSASHDCTVQLWDVLGNNLLGTFSDHQDSVLCAAWSMISTNHVITGSSDCSLRIWDTDKHPPSNNIKKKSKQKKKCTLAKTLDASNATVTDSKKPTETVTQNLKEIQIENSNEKNEEPNLASLNKLSKKKTHRKILPLTLARKQYKRSTIEGCRRLFKNILESSDNENSTLDYSDGYDYLRIYGKQEAVIELLNIEQLAHKETFYWDAWAVVGILKGDLKEVLDTSAEQNNLTPALLSLAPSVSFRFWKEILAKYIIQMENDYKNIPEGTGLDTLGKVWEALLLFSIGQVDEGCLVLGGAGLEAEAICAARARHIDHIAERHLTLWAKEHLKSGLLHKAAECYLALGLVMDAATVLGNSNNEEDLALAAEMAKFAGNAALADSYSKQNP